MRVLGDFSSLLVLVLVVLLAAGAHVIEVTLVPSVSLPRVERAEARRVGCRLAEQGALALGDLRHAATGRPS